MFTGIIEEVGEIAGVDDTGEFRTIRVRAGWHALMALGRGDSIAVNGVCLTVRTFASRQFHGGSFAGNAGSNKPAESSAPESIVNLERPMRADGRFGGHIVQGHVDGVGRIRSFDTRLGTTGTWRSSFRKRHCDTSSRRVRLRIDGISLTVAAVKRIRA